jgi:hypothetical protein
MGDDRVGAILIGGPDRGGGGRKAEKPRRRMQHSSAVPKRLRAEKGEIREFGRGRVLGMVGLDPGVLQPSYVAKIADPESS